MTPNRQTLKISQKKNCGFWDAGLGPQGTVADSHMGPEKNETGQYSVSTIIWVLGVVGAANYTP